MRIIARQLNQLQTWRTILWSVIILGFVAACSPTEAPVTPTAEIIINRSIATVVISPTPDAQQIQATRQAASPTPAPPTPTVLPTETPYVGVFIGRVDREAGFRNFTEPLFADEFVSAGPTAAASRCGIIIDRVFRAAWSNTPDVNQSLRCPIQEGFGFYGQAQVFENGVIYRRPDTREVWAITSNGTFGEYWFVEAPPAVDMAGVQAPPDFTLPTGDIASVWYGVDGVSDALGYALTDAQEIPINLQRFSGGTFLLDGTAGQSFALVVDGSLYGPFDAPPGLLPSETEDAPFTLFTPTPEESTAPDNGDAS